MLKKAYEDNENKKVNSREINILKENFPQYFNKDGDFKIDEFKKMLENDEVNFDKEGYRLDFLGKSYARFESALETETVITPDTKHNNEEINKNSENMYIVGDNIDALKHLLKSYSGKVKCIYIDPPYNTGSDGFVYPDNFKFDKDTLSNKMGESEEEADRILSLQGKSTHSAWLTFMYPRLLLARDLLADDGVIFISIDDNEQSNLKMICDEIFGEINFVSNLIRLTTSQRSEQENNVNISQDYILTYSKSEATNLFKVNINTENKKKIMKDKIGLYYKGDTKAILAAKSQGYSKGGDYDFEYNGTVYSPVDSEGNRNRWLWSKTRMKAAAELGILVETSSSLRMQIYQDKRFDEETNTMVSKEKGLRLKSTDLVKPRYSNPSGKNDLKILGMNYIFSNPKPVELIKVLLELSSDNNSIVMDFFSGSATTAEGVMQLNSEDGRNRKYILVQIPEKIQKNKSAYKAGYRTIDEIGRERIKRAASKIKEETGADIDYGFKLYRLNEPTVQTIDKLIDFDPNDINFNENDYVSNFEFDGENGKDTILTTWLNEDGYGLLAQANPFKIGDYEAYKYKNSLYIINSGIKSSDIMELIKLLEKNQLDINRVVAYGYSLNFNITNELRNNLKNLKNNQSVILIERY